MGYVIDRTRALRTSDVIAIIQIRQRRGRSQVVLGQHSLYHTLTRAQTLTRHIRHALPGTRWERARRTASQ